MTESLRDIRKRRRRNRWTCVHHNIHTGESYMKIAMVKNFFGVENYAIYCTRCPKMIWT